MAELKRGEAVLRNLAQELLTEEECHQFKQALHYFRVSHSVTTLCQQLKHVINTTQKILLLVELSSRVPKHLQEDFHRLCSLQYPNYDTYLKIFTSGNALNEIPKIIAQDSSGKFKIISKGSEKKMMIKYNNQKNIYELHSLPGTSVTSGVYSDAGDDDDDNDDDIDKSIVDFTLTDPPKPSTPGTPVYLKGKKNVHRVTLNRHDDGTLGFGITGGKEYGRELIISVVEEGGPAANQGLKVGDKILEVNGHSFYGMTHAEAVTIMRNAWNLIMYLESPAETENFGWSGNLDVPDHIVHKVQNIELVVYPAQNGRLGCVTQRLPNLDLIVKSVEENSPASKAGLRVADHITRVDHINVNELSEKQIMMLTKSKRLNVSVRRDVTLSADETDYVSHRQGRKTEVASRQRRVSSRSPSDERSTERDNSPEFRFPAHYSSHNSLFQNREIYVPSPRSPAVSAERSRRDQPEHLVYGKKPSRDGNWVLSPQSRERRYTQRKDMPIREPIRYAYPVHGRSLSEGRYYEYRERENIRNSGQYRSGVSRYVRNRSQSPHRSVTVKQIQHEDNVIRAIQAGLEKRQRAIRLSLYQMPDPADYEWEI